MTLLDSDPPERVIEGVKHGWIAIILLLLVIALALIGYVSLQPPQPQLTRIVRYLFTGFFVIGTAYGIVWLAFTYLYPDLAVEYDFQFPHRYGTTYPEVESRVELSLQRVFPYLYTIGMAIGALWVWTTM